jgi:hypothetical protein
MVEAIARDLASIEDVSVDITLQDGLEAELPEQVRIKRVATLEEALESFDLLARKCDGTLIIAPEIDGELARRARRVAARGGRLLGATPEAIELASDKLLFSRHLARHGVPSIPAELLPAGALGSARSPSLTPAWPVVVKPRRGAGSTDTFLLEETSPWPATRGELIITPFSPGLPASVLALVGPNGALTLRAGEQLLSADGRLRYLGGRLPLAASLEARAAKLALRALAAAPGLLGFAGVDLLLDREGREQEDKVVEINARLTTSYVGLRALSRVNLARCWLSIVQGEDPPALSWRPARIRFFPDGSVEEEESVTEEP